MTREQMIYQCLQKLPYPVSFYDKLSDGSLYNVWNKHVVLGIPIDKRQKKYKASNDQARAEEASRKQTAINKQPEYEQLDLFSYAAEKQKEEDSKPITAEEFARRCLNRGEINFITIHIFGETTCHTIVDNGLTVEEYYELITPPKPAEEPYILYNDHDGCYYRRMDNGDLMILTDEEALDYKETGGPIGCLEPEEPEKGPVLVLKPRKNN